MKKSSLTHGRIALAAGLAVVLILAAGATFAGSPAAAAAAASVTLEYKMPSGQVLRYQTKEDQRQIIDMMGQVVESTSSSASKFSVQSKGRQDKNHLLGVTIDEMTINISGMQGDMSPDMAPVLGKGFDMVLSPLGVEVDVSGAKALTYDSADGTRNLSSGFKVFFPDLPGKPVKVGDTWPTKYTIEEQTDSVDIRIDIDSVNTLDGFETVDGMECARITAKNTGTITGTGSQQGQELQFSGTLTGTDTWFFAVKEGLYVGSKGESGGDMTIAVAGMTIPATQTITSEIKLVGK
ncbi:MAG: hypothetical protein R6X21_03945 [Candidatus Aminicenantes bacterium]